MYDIYFATGILVALSALGFFAGRKAAQKTGSKWIPVLAAGATLLTFFYHFYVQGQTWMAEIIPFSSVIIFGNPTLPLMMFLAGCLFTRLKSPVRKWTYLFVLLTVSVYTTYWEVLAERPTCYNITKEGVSLQSTSFSCGPAAAATLLRSVGVETTECEMARACFTTKSGTSLLGLFRGLKVKLKNTPFDIQAFSCKNAGELKKETGPVLISMELVVTENTDPRYQKKWGWEPGQKHTVVLFGFKKGQPVIGDPSFGMETWNFEGLATLFTGNGFRVVKRR